MAMNAEDRPRSPEVQRAQAEERRQRLEEQKHELEVRHYELEERKHQLEKTKISVDVHKHYATVITALLFIFSYFGDRIIPALTGIPLLGISLWNWALLGLFMSIVVALTALQWATISPDKAGGLNTLVRWMLIVVNFALFMTIVMIAWGMANHP